MTMHSLVIMCIVTLCRLKREIPAVFFHHLFHHVCQNRQRQENLHPNRYQPQPIPKPY